MPKCAMRLSCGTLPLKGSVQTTKEFLMKRFEGKIALITGGPTDLAKPSPAAS